MTFPGIPDRECETIGLMLQHPPSVSEYADRLPARAFTNMLTRAVWEAMVDLAKAGTMVSIPALREAVKLNPMDFKVPSIPAFLATCKGRATGDLSLSDLVDLMADMAMREDVSAALVEVQKLAAGDGLTGEELALRAARMLTDIVSGQKHKDTMSLHEAARAFAEQVSGSFQRGEPIGHDWGLRELDRIMGTIQPGDFGVLGGPSGQGKTALAMQIAMHIARRLPVLMIQAEMRHEDVAGRELLGMTGVSSEAVESGGAQAGEVEMILSAADRLRGVPLEIVYTDDMRVSKIRTRIQSFMSRYGGKCGLVIVDTIKHVDPEEKRQLEGAARVMASAPKLDKMAKSLNVPIMALAQVKQTYYERAGKQFYKNDLFGGGDLCEVASWVLLMHQPALRAEVNGGRGADEIIRDWDGFAQVIAGKRRRGKAGAGKLKWVPERTRFADPDDDVGETFL